MSKPQLIWVYNADSGFVSSLTDFAHKILSPSTYQCELCTLTHGNVFIKQEWKSFIENLPAKNVFLYKDQFAKQYNRKVDAPQVLIHEGARLKPLITRDEISACTSVAQLRDLVISKLNVR